MTLSAETALRWAQLPGVAIKTLLVLYAKCQQSEDGWTRPATRRALMKAGGVSPSASLKIFEAVDAEFEVKEGKSGERSYRMRGDRKSITVPGEDDRKSITEPETRSEIYHDEALDVEQGDRKPITVDEARSEIDHAETEDDDGGDRKSITEPEPRSEIDHDDDRKPIAIPEARSEIDHAENAPGESLNTKDKDSSQTGKKAPPRKKRASTTKVLPPKPPYWGELVGAVIAHMKEPRGTAVKIAEQLAGVAVGGVRGEHNCDPPAHPEEIEPFVRWYKADHADADLPTSADTLDRWWYRFVQDRKAGPNGTPEKSAALERKAAALRRLEEWEPPQYTDDEPPEYAGASGL